MAGSATRRILGGIGGLLLAAGVVLGCLGIFLPAPAELPGQPVYGLRADAEEVQLNRQDLSLTVNADGSVRASWLCNLQSMGGQADVQLYLPLFFSDRSRAPELPVATLDNGNLSAEAVFLPYDDYDPEDLPAFRDARDFLFQSPASALPELSSGLTLFSLDAVAEQDCVIRAALVSDQAYAVGQGFSQLSRTLDTTVFTALFQAGETIRLRVFATGGTLSFAGYAGSDPDKLDQAISLPASQTAPVGLESLLNSLLGLGDTGLDQIPDDYLVEGGFSYAQASRLMASRLSYDFRSSRALLAPGPEDLFCGTVYAVWTLPASATPLDFRVSADLTAKTRADGRLELRLLTELFGQDILSVRLSVYSDLPVTDFVNLSAQGNRAFLVTDSPASLLLGQPRSGFPFLALGIPLAVLGLSGLLIPRFLPGARPKR